MCRINSFVFTLLLFASGAANAVVIDVFAKDNSVITGSGGASTGVFLNTGDFFTATAAQDDLWSAGPLPRWSNADGLKLGPPLLATGSDESGEAAGTTIGQFFGGFNYDGLTLPFGSLVGSIGDSNFFFVGTDFSGNAIGTGELLLWYWDADGADNSDSIQVTITGGNDGQGNGDNGNDDPVVVPEPSVLTLLALGLIGTGLVRRRYS